MLPNLSAYESRLERADYLQVVVERLICARMGQDALETRDEYRNRGSQEVAKSASVDSTVSRAC